MEQENEREQKNHIEVRMPMTMDETIGRAYRIWYEVREVHPDGSHTHCSDFRVNPILLLKQHLCDAAVLDQKTPKVFGLFTVQRYDRRYDRKTAGLSTRGIRFTYAAADGLARKLARDEAHGIVKASEGNLSDVLDLADEDKSALRKAINEIRQRYAS